MNSTPPALAGTTIGNMKVIEVLHAHELQRIFASVSPQLEHVQVNTPSALEPWMVAAEGALMMYGQPFFWSVPLDLREIKTAEDVLSIAGSILTSFEKASQSPELRSQV